MPQVYGSTGIGFMFWRSTIDDSQTEEFLVIKTRFNTYAESVHRILQTLPLERPHQADIGCLLRKLLFEPNDFYLHRAADYAIRNALESQEPRLQIVSLTFQTFESEKIVSAKLTLMEKATQAQFYLQENIQL